MGLLRFSNFSSIPTLFKKIQSRREQKEKYSPTFVEWGMINGTQIAEAADQTGSGETTLFTVPGGDVFYLTSAMIAAAETAGVAATKTGAINIVTGVSGNTSILGWITRLANGNFSGSISLGMPLRLGEGTVISVAASADSTARASIQGFTIPKSLEIV